MNFSKVKEDFQDYTYAQRRALLVLALIAILLATLAFSTTRGRAVAQEPAKPILTMPEVSKTILVHVAGKVKRPDVYPLLQGSRVADAIKAAGGAKKGVDLGDINLARVLIDGEQVYVGYIAKVSASGSSKSSKGIYTGIININRATKAEFDSLSGIGPVIAGRIINYRSSNGPFMALDDLLKVSGIGSKTLERIRPRLSL